MSLNAHIRGAAETSTWLITAVNRLNPFASNNEYEVLHEVGIQIPSLRHIDLGNQPQDRRREPRFPCNRSIRNLQTSKHVKNPDAI